MGLIFRYLRDDAGAITVDWVVVTAGVLLAAIVAVYAIFNNGVANLVQGTNDVANTAMIDVDPGTVKNMNP